MQPAALDDGWDSEPFTLVERDGKGSSSLGQETSGGAFLLSYLGATLCLSEVILPEQVIFTSRGSSVLEVAHMCTSH